MPLDAESDAFWRSHSLDEFPSAIEAHEVELALRVAVNTGEVVVGADDADLVGDALNVGARLESECPHGHVVVGEHCHQRLAARRPP